MIDAGILQPEIEAHPSQGNGLATSADGLAGLEGHIRELRLTSLNGFHRNRDGVLSTVLPTALGHLQRRRKRSQVAKVASNLATDLEIHGIVVPMGAPAEGRVPDPTGQESAWMAPGEETEAPSVTKMNPVWAVGRVWPGAPSPPTTAMFPMSANRTGRTVNSGPEPHGAAAWPVGLLGPAPSPPQLTRSMVAIVSATKPGRRPTGRRGSGRRT